MLWNQNCKIVIMPYELLLKVTVFILKVHSANDCFPLALAIMKFHSRQIISFKADTCFYLTCHRCWKYSRSDIMNMNLHCSFQMQVKGLLQGEWSKYFVHSCPLDVYYFTFQDKRISCPGHFSHHHQRKNILHKK